MGDPSDAISREPVVVLAPVVKWPLAIPVAGASCRDLPEWLCFWAVVYLTAQISVQSSSEGFPVKQGSHLKTSREDYPNPVTDDLTGQAV